MARNNRYSIANIKRFIYSSDLCLQRSVLNKLLNNFSCPQNQEIEYFLKNNAIEFARKEQSVTHFVFSSISNELLAFFTITIKQVDIPTNCISNTIKNKLLRIGRPNSTNDTISLPAFLIAQLSKNFTNSNNDTIKGCTQ